MELNEKQISSKELYRSASYSFCVDNVLLPDGRTHTREVLKHPGGVAILAINEKNQVALVRQYRYPIQQVTLEIPAGKLDKNPGETPEAAAARELREETGFVAEDIKYLGEIYPSPGVVSELLYIFYASGLRKTTQELDEDEFINAEWIDKDVLLQKITDGDIKDTKAIAACFFALRKNII